MGTTVLIEPSAGGHRFERAADVVRVAAVSGPVVLLTTAAAQDSEAYRVHLAGLPVELRPVFTDIRPPTRDLADAAASVCAATQVDAVVLMDGDVALKRWWRDAPRAFRSGARPRRIVVMLTRYPTRLSWRDLASWRKRGPKAILVLAARLCGVLDRAAGFAGRDDTSAGWVVKRARDPAVCSAHARDRARLRSELELPTDRTIVGIFGGINARKNVPMVWAAMEQARLDADLLLAGPFDDDTVKDWLTGLDPAARQRVIVRDGFWPNEVLDAYVASADVAPLAIENNGPSGIMGKAWAAGVPVVTAGSLVRAREVAATGAGRACDFDVRSIAAALAAVVHGSAAEAPASVVPLATGDEFARSLLGVDDHGRVTSRRWLR